MRTCGPDKSSKNDRKTQINPKTWGGGGGGTSDILPKVCVGGGGGHVPPCPHQMTPMGASECFI